MQSDADTVESVLAGRQEAYAELVRRYEAVVHAVAMGILRDHHAAQDVCQEAFVAAYRGLSTLRDPSSFGSWIRTIARNHALTLVRQPTEHRLSECPEVPANGDGCLDERAERMMDLVAGLREPERNLVMLKYIGGYSLEQISAMTGQPVGTIGAQLHRARARLREKLEEVKP